VRDEEKKKKLLGISNSSPKKSKLKTLSGTSPEYLSDKKRKKKSFPTMECQMEFKASTFHQRQKQFSQYQNR
jgi:hypothetical protein